jgi:hypothetical protein
MGFYFDIDQISFTKIFSHEILVKIVFRKMIGFKFHVSLKNKIFFVPDYTLFLNYTMNYTVFLSLRLLLATLFKKIKKIKTKINLSNLNKYEIILNIFLIEF